MSDAARQRRSRERKRRGLACYTVEVDPNTFWALEIAGLLPEFTTDRGNVEAALTAALADWSKQQVASRVTLIGRGRS